MADEIKQLDLFGEEVRPKAKYVQGQVGKDDYGEFTVMRDEVSPSKLSALASQKAVGKTIFGKGWLISEKKAAEKKAAEKVIVWELSDMEREAVRRIDKKKKIKQNGND